MRKALVIVLTLLVAAHAFAQDLPEGITRRTVAGGSCVPVRGSLTEDSYAFQAGERLTFTVHYTWGVINSDVGVAYIDVDTLRVNGERSFKCRAYGKTVRWYDRLFKVREDFTTWFTADGFVPLKFTRDTNEGKYVSKNNYNYVWDTAEPYISADTYTSRRGWRNKSLPLDHCTFDLPSLFYFARNMDFDRVASDERYPMTFAIDDDVYDVYFIMKGRETLKLKGIGSIDTIKFAVKLVAGNVFTGDEDMSIWISDDDNRIPVYLEAPILVGFASAKIADWSGLKHEFSSLTPKK